MDIPIISKAIRKREEAIEERVLSAIPKAPLSKKGEKFYDVLGGILDIPSQGLSNETSISGKLLKANKEWVYRNNDVIAMEVSKMNFELYSVGLSKGEIVFNEVQTHPLLTLLDKPNAETTKSDALYIVQSHKKLAGDAFWLKIRSGRTVVGLRSLPPDKIKLDLQNPSPSDPTVIKGFIYRDVIDGEKIYEYYPPEEIIHIKKPNPNNYFRGYGAVEALAETIDVDNLTNLTTKNFFQKGAITNFVLSTEQKINDDQIKRIQAEMKQMYGGAQNAYRTMILGGGLTPNKLSFSNKDMEFLAQLTWYRDKIMVGFGNTPASLGIVEDVNRANAEATIVGWKRSTVKPDMDSIINALNEFLVPEFGKNLILAYTDPIPEDRTDDIEEATKLYSGGIIMKNEARELLQYESVEGGDEFYSPAGGLPGAISDSDNPVDEEVDQIEEGEGGKSMSKNLRIRKHQPGEVPHSLKSMDFKYLLRRNGFYLKKDQNKQLKEMFKPLAEKIIKEHKKKGKAITPEEAYKLAESQTGDGYQPPKHAKFSAKEIMDYYQKQVHSVEVVEDHFDQAIVKFLTHVNTKIFDKLVVEVEAQKSAKAKKKVLGDWKAKGVFDDLETEFLTKAELDFTPLLENLGVIAGQEAYKLVGEDDPFLLSRSLKDLIARNVRRFTKSMLETDRDHVINVITSGIENGKSVLDIRNGLIEDLEFTKMQAQRIGRTEVLRASNQSAIDAWEQSGVVEGKQWITAGATDECADYEGAVETLKGNFYSDTSEFKDGDPPLHPNCKCVVIPIVTGSN